MFKKITYILLLFIFLTSCRGTFDSVKRGLTGAKKTSADEFLVEKKDPLIKPPNFEELPVPGSNTSNTSSLEGDVELQSLKNLEIEQESYELEETGSTESNILKRIRKK